MMKRLFAVLLVCGIALFVAAPAFAAVYVAPHVVTERVHAYQYTSSGSGEFPRDLLILRPCSSRMMLVKYTSLNGMRSSSVVRGLPLRRGAPFMNSMFAMIMRATQKKMISGAVTSESVGLK